ncbi:hypothetical protein HKD37_05G012553 [Glycine soja]
MRMRGLLKESTSCFLIRLSPLNPIRATRGGALESTRDAIIANGERLSDYIEQYDLYGSGSSMFVPSQLRSSYFNPNFSLQQHQHRTFFPGIAFSFDNTNNNTSTLLNFQSNTLKIHALRTMATPPALSPPPSPPPPPAVASASPSTLKRTHKATRLRSLATRPPRAERPVVHVDPAIDKADGPHKNKLRTYLGIVARDKVDVTYETWKEVPAAQKDLIWEDIQPTRTVWTTLSVKNTALARRNEPSFVRATEIPCGRMCGKKHRPSRSKTLPSTCCLVGKLMAEKTKKKLEEVAQSGSTEGINNPPSTIRRHVKWKMAHTKKTRQITSEAAKEIAEKIASQGLFVPHRRQDVLTTAIGRPEHPGRMRAARAGVTIKQYFGSAPRSSRSSSSIPPEELEDQLEELITEKMQSQGLALPLEPEVGPSTTRVSTKGSCVDPSPTDLEMSDLDKCRLYIKENPFCLVALGRVYEGSTVVHNIPLLHGQVRVGVEEVKDTEAPILVPTDEAAVSPAKPPDRPHPEVDDPLYLITLTILQLFLRPLQVMWDAIVFGTSHCTSSTKISLKLHTMVNVLAYLFYTGNSDVYGFLEPQSIQRSGQSQFESESYIKSWMQSSKRDVYLRAYLNGLDNYLKRIINSVLKGLDDTSQPKSKAGARWIVVKYFNDVRPLEAERLKALRIQWAQFYLKVTNQS